MQWAVATGLAAFLFEPEQRQRKPYLSTTDLPLHMGKKVLNYLRRTLPDAIQHMPCRPNHLLTRSYMTILIIGATSGIGYALAEAYIQAGWTVGLTGRRVNLLEPLRALAPDRVQTRRHDVTAADSIRVVAELVDDLGGVQVLVYNSGIGIYNKQLDWPPERDTIAVNVTGFAEVCGWAYRYFEQQGGGHLVAVSSIAALRGNRTAPAYNASKAFMANYLEGLRERAIHQHLPLFVTDIRPGFVETPMTRQNPRMFWVASPARAARQIQAAIARKAKVAYITRRWALAAAFIYLAPDALYRRLMG